MKMNSSKGWLKSVFFTFSLLDVIITVSRLWVHGTFSASYNGRYSTSRKVAVRVSMRSLNLFNVSNPSGRTMALGFTQSLTEISIRGYLGGKARPARKPIT
jgi:hypothetical protein